MKYNVVLTEPAEQDLGEITGDIFKKHGKSFNQKLINRINDIINSLQKIPFNNMLVSDERLVTTGIRTVTIDNYLIFYIASEKDKTVSIVRILSFRRNWAHLL